MASTRRPSQADQVASNARRRVAGGCTFADVPNAVTSAAAIVHQVSTHRNTTPLRVTRSSRASSPASIGFTTTVRKNSLPARSLPLLTRTRWINRCRDRMEQCLQTGKRCFTNRGCAPRSAGAIRLPRSRHKRHDFAMIVPQYARTLQLRERPLVALSGHSETRDRVRFKEQSRH